MNLTARFAKDAKDAELQDFSFAVERTAKEKHSAFDWWTSIIDRYLSPTKVPPCPLGLRILAFRPLSGKLKKSSLSVLCGSAVKTTDPFRVNIKPPILRAVVDW